ncbi:WD40/YVTN/BNR-like repeat-containing protein [Winogradskyella sp.]|uniref:WD40/YVTN/BNR-like repeat-containing protein n=1 Tax=Winogradskyella sp. TaxID=1883156 RepID=UPI003515FC98
MKSKITLIAVLVCTVFFFNSSVAQSQEIEYKRAPVENESNYFEITAQKRAGFQVLKSMGTLSRSQNKAYKQFERWAYFWKDRINSDGTFPSPLEGWKNVGLLDNVQAHNPTSASQSTQSWTNIGPQTNPVPNGYPNPPQLGRLNAFWRYKDMSNESGSVLIVGAPTGGIWKSTDNGATWSPKFDTFAGIGITDIKGSSTDTSVPGVLYATTGDYDAQEVLNSIGVYKSTDMGETWTATNLSYALSGAQLLGYLVVVDDNTVVVGAADHIKRTTDGGATWTDVLTGDFSGQNFGRMASFGTNIVCTDALEGIHFSTDSGATWTTLQAATGNSGKHAVTVDETGVFFVQNQMGQIKQLDLTGSGSATNVGTIPPPI